MALGPKGKGRPNGHIGSYKQRPRRERALSRLQARLSSSELTPAQRHSFEAEASALRKRLGVL